MRNRLYNLGWALFLAMLFGSMLWAGCRQQPTGTTVSVSTVPQINTASWAVSAVAVAEAAQGGASSPLIVGEILDVYIDYTAALSSTTDLTVSYYSPFAMSNILVVTDSATDALYHPRAKPVDLAGAAITNAFVPFWCNGYLTVTVAQTKVGAAGMVYVRYVK